MWLSRNSKKRKQEKVVEEEEEEMPFSLPFNFGKLSAAHVHSIHNRIYFNDDITTESVTLLNRELRHMEEKMLLVGNTFKVDPPPIYLYLTTDGGEIYSAFSVIDCINQLKVPVYTVVDGFVASAGTLISLAGKKRFIMPNAYMLIHQLRSGVWGKMSEITEEYDNLKKLMDHLISYYSKHTEITVKQLEKLLAKDSIWNAEECIRKKLVQEIMQ
jgi:ATP-dependent Clp endopeptidase proteolytic subunit ClpP